MTLPQAVAFGDAETIRMVWDRSDEKERVSNSALIRLAIDFHHVEVARWLLQEQPLWMDLGRLFARETLAFDVLSRLPKGGEVLPTLENRNRAERNPNFDGAVADAVETKSTSWLAAALLAGGDPNTGITDYEGTLATVLCDAAGVGHEDGVRLLLHFGADPNKSWDGLSALGAGAQYPRIVALLLDEGANPNERSLIDMYNPLASAAKAKSIESLRLMLARGGDASLVDEYGSNVLHAALTSTTAECCRELLSHGADPCGLGGIHRRETPMHVVAVSAGWPHDGPERVKILELLREAGASVLAVDQDGLTPGQRAREGRRTSKEVLDWFSRHETV
jgi:hypothetical protein